MSEAGGNLSKNRDGKASLLLAIIVFAVLLARTNCEIAAPVLERGNCAFVEVRGEVPRPGTFMVPGKRVSACDALVRAGMVDSFPDDICSRTLRSGQSATLIDQGGRLQIHVDWMSADKRLVLGQKLDLNRATESDLLLVPQMKPEIAAAIVQERRKKPWASVEELTLLHGVGQKTAEHLRTYLEVCDTGAGED
jgi:hypothetical protein